MESSWPSPPPKLFFSLVCNYFMIIAQTKNAFSVQIETLNRNSSDNLLSDKNCPVSAEFLHSICEVTQPPCCSETEIIPTLVVELRPSWWHSSPSREPVYCVYCSSLPSPLLNGLMALMLRNPRRIESVVVTLSLHRFWIQWRIQERTLFTHTQD